MIKNIGLRIWKVIRLLFFWSFILIFAKFAINLFFYLVLIVVIIVMPPKTTFIYNFQFNIYAFQDNHTYVVSRYSVDNNNTYDYMRRDSDGAFFTERLDQAESRIFESTEIPMVKVYREEPIKYKILYRDLIFMAMFIPQQNFGIFGHQYDFYIPNGSVGKNFNADMK